MNTLRVVNCEGEHLGIMLLGLPLRGGCNEQVALTEFHFPIYFPPTKLYIGDRKKVALHPVNFICNIGYVTRLA